MEHRLPKLARCAALLAATALFPARGSAEEAAVAPPGPRLALVHVVATQPSRFPKPAMVYTGIGLSVIGTALAVGGAAILASIPASVRDCQAHAGDDCGLAWAWGGLLGGGILGVGVLHLGAGIPLIAVGARTPPPPPPALQGLGAPPAGTSARTVSLQWTF